ncbi:aldo/keto reductase [Acidocella facilis]|uniref:aldo/keto reductase n=1 Tax=Acidocella facilis TaxID=525 RepID=UPI001FD4CEDF|nr:aldo/keto reductase [Acidocella facilis]
MSDKISPPAVALGTWAWGDSGEAGDGYFGSSLTLDGLEELVTKAHACGFTFWDTARVYGMGRAETRLGQVLKRFPRGDYQLSTKFTPQAAGRDDDPVAEMLEQSLASLNTDIIDLYWIHNPADVMRWTPHLIPLLKSGKVKHVGVSNHSLDDLKRADQILGEAGFRVGAIQNHYSLLYRNPEHAGILAHSRTLGIPFFAYMVLEQGALTGRYGPANPLPTGSRRAEIYNGMLSRVEALTDKLTSIGKTHNAVAAEIAVAWAIAKGAVPIIGVTKPQHVGGLVRARDIALTGEEIADLEAVADAAQVNTRGWWEKEM